MTSLIRIPFAESGDKTAVPETDVGGGVNMTQGYGLAYALDPATDPSAKRIEREKMNGLFNLITSAIAEIQASGCVPFITADDNGGTAYSYGKGAVAILDGVVYQSLENSNTDTPPSTKWGEVSSVGRLINIKSFPVSAIYTPTPGTKKVRVKVWGAGGGGGNSSVVGIGGFSGGGGGYAESYIDVSSILTVTVTVGSGGAAVAGGTASAATVGGTSSFGSYLSCSGGSGSGGVATGGSVINSNGQGGQGPNGSIGGVGGAAYSAYGGLPHSTYAGDNGGYPGGGGAGGSYANTSSAYSSGKGSNGFVLVEEYS